MLVKEKSHAFDAEARVAARLVTRLFRNQALHAGELIVSKHSRGHWLSSLIILTQRQREKAEPLNCQQLLLVLVKRLLFCRRLPSQAPLIT